MIRIDRVHQLFADLLKSLTLPENWREIIRKQMLAEAQATGQTEEATEREKERLKLKRVRILKQHREGYIGDDEFAGEMAAVELALRQLNMPEVNGVRYEDVVEAGEHLPGMSALWDVAIAEERREMVTLMLEPGGMYVDLELKIVAAIKPRPAFLPILRMLNGVVEFDETRGLLLVDPWCERNRRESVSLSPTLTLFLAPHGKLYLRLQDRVPESESVRLAASPPPKTMASYIEIPDAVPSSYRFSNGYPK
jgi:site-specific DNA recombinase